jgi:transposase
MTKWVKADEQPRRIVRAELPPSVWPRTMADPSAIAELILAKYDMSLPLHRQERASPRLGFYLPRSTQCGWLSEANGYLYRIVDAMMIEARATAHCIATDATTAPIRQLGECGSWHLFVFIADQDHIVFRAVPEHTSAAIVGLLSGFKGRLLSDASSVYDVLHREHGVLAFFCWAHLRRYFWRSRDTDPARAHEALAIIAKLFEVERDTADIPMPAKTVERARRATPILAMFDAWIERVRPGVEPRTPLAAALTYYDNQREGLRRFLDDGRVRIDNNLCEQQLRNLVLGRRNWTFFVNPNGLRWYAVFRSLIASCALHGLEPGRYLEEILRLAPHWPLHRMLDLSPRYWSATRAALTPGGE